MKAVPDGYHTLTPSLTVKDGAKAIDFYNHKKDPSPAEMEKGQKEFLASMARKKS